MSLVLLYLLLLKASVTAFSGMGGLPQIRQDLVVTHRVLADAELNRALLFGRSSPGPVGLYVVSIGYAVRGVPGAIVGWLALVSPAFLVIPLLALIRRWLHLSRMRGAVDALIIAGATMLVPSGVLLIVDAVKQVAPFVNANVGRPF